MQAAGRLMMHPGRDAMGKIEEEMWAAVRELGRESGELREREAALEGRSSRGLQDLKTWRRHARRKRSDRGAVLACGRRTGGRVVRRWARASG
jgi:hypothetical protein